MKITQTLLLLLLSLTLFSQKKKTFNEDKKIIYDNHIYENYIRTVQLYPVLSITKNPQEALNPPVLNLTDAQVLKLEFDCLATEFSNFRVKIVHCNADWTPSSLNDVEFLTEFNDFPINDYHNSFATKIPYIHFAAEIPKTKVAGNFLVIVYKNRNENDIMFTRRFLVYQNQLRVSGSVVFPNNAQKRLTHQQVNFSVNYAGYEVLDPKMDLKILIRQNFRDSRVLSNLKPFMIDAYNQKIDYQFFEGENQMEGLNEFRLFDGRSTQQKLVGIDKIIQGPQESIIEIRSEKPQNGLGYVSNNDFNGMYVIDNYETNRGDTESDYVRFSFQLKMDSLDNKKVYINGAFNDWQLNEVNQMHYVPESQSYEAFIQLKQGVYNYNYVTKDALGNISETELEGTHSQTENVYEVLVYHRPIGARADALVGYVLLKNR